MIGNYFVGFMVGGLVLFLSIWLFGLNLIQFDGIIFYILSVFCMYLGLDILCENLVLMIKEVKGE
jgi:hypothetical protein|tara:strand:- start:236 stop:430 length:195 start_codon:yes stop_codon:yes gene_type:complete